jgi:hypothetical protein
MADHLPTDRPGLPLQGPLCEGKTLPKRPAYWLQLSDPCPEGLAARAAQAALPRQAEFVACEQTIYDRFVRWSRLGVFNRIFARLAGRAGEPDRLMIDATHLKAHRTAASLPLKLANPDHSGAGNVVAPACQRHRPSSLRAKALKSPFRSTPVLVTSPLGSARRANSSVHDSKSRQNLIERRNSSTGPGAPLLLRVSPEDIVPHAGWQCVRRSVMERLKAGAAIVAVIGAAGTGKTLLLADLARALRAEGHAVRILQGLDGSSGPSAGNAREVVLADEADRASDTALTELLGGEGAYVLTGLPSLASRLKALGIMVPVVALMPLAPEDVPEFIAARLLAAGKRPDLLSPEAIQEIAACSGGTPRLINSLTGAAVFAATLEGASRVTAEHVMEAASLRADGSPPAASEQPLAPPEASAVPSPQPILDPRATGWGTNAAFRPDMSAVGGAPPALAILRSSDGETRARLDEPDASATPLRTNPAGGNDAGSAAAGHLSRERQDIPVRSLRAAEPLVRRAVPEHPRPVRRAALIGLALAGLGVAAWVGMLFGREGSSIQQSTTAWQAPSVRETTASGDAAEEDGSPAATAPEGNTPEASSRRPWLAGPESVLPIPPPPPPAPQAAAGKAAPAAVRPRIVIHHRANSSRAEAEADRLATLLSSEFGTVEERVVAYGPQVPTARYFYAEDAAAAERIAAVLAATGTTWRVQNLSTFRPLPRQGTIEIWLP